MRRRTRVAILLRFEKEAEETGHPRLSPLLQRRGERGGAEFKLRSI
jgi:hypothetical protein